MFDRAAIVSAGLALYETVILMANRPASDVHVPPPHGWSFSRRLTGQINAVKTKEVFDLMRHLPCVDGIQVAPSTFPINYLDDDLSSARHMPLDRFEGEKADIAEYELALTFQDDGVGGCFMPCAIHGEGQRCPLLCRHQLGIAIRPVVEVLNEWRTKLRCLERMVKGDGNVVGEADFDEPDLEPRLQKMRRIYLEHGQPDSFRPGECMEAITGIRDDDDEGEDEEDATAHAEL